MEALFQTGRERQFFQFMGQLNHLLIVLQIDLTTLAAIEVIVTLLFDCRGDLMREEIVEEFAELLARE